MIQVLLVHTQKNAYVMVSLSTYVFSMPPEFVPTYPNGHSPHAEKDVYQVLYSAMDGRRCQKKYHGDTVPKKRAAWFYVLYRLKKKVRQAQFSTAGYVWTTWEKRNFHPDVLISSVGVHPRNAFVLFQKGLHTTRQTDIKPQKACRPPDRWTYRHFIFSLWGFEAMACICTRCAYLQAARMNLYCWFKAIFQKKIRYN